MKRYSNVLKAKAIGCLLFSIAIFWSLTTAAEESDSALSVHGFLTQAYAASDGNTIFGIPDDGTTDYRNAAIQFRYSLTDRDSIVLQLSHERLGQSNLNDFQSDIELDWAFVQHSFNDATWIKAGRVQIPTGIYNEIRDVGTVLPFYRPSPNVYGDHTFTSETVDGVVGFHRLFGDTAWPVEWSGHYGGWNFIQDSQGTLQTKRVENAFGTQIWFQTPLDGLRFGIHGGRQTIRDGLLIPEPGKREHTSSLYVSADATFEKYFLRSEYRYQGFPDGKWQAFYAQAGYSFTEKIAVAAQYDMARIKIDQLPYLFIDEEFDRDLALSVRYFFKPNLVLKIENHWNRGKRPTEPLAIVGLDQSLRTSYFILSVSASF